MYNFNDWSDESIYTAMNYALGYVEDGIADITDILFIEVCRNELANRKLERMDDREV